MCTLCVLGGDVGMFNIAGRVFCFASVQLHQSSSRARDKIHVRIEDRAEMHVWIAFEQEQIAQISAEGL